jgi:protein-L-isoaspartate(D-aspartate) O-methyltransferase
MNNDYRLSRERMVKNQLMPRGITDKRVLAAMGKVQRHIFMEEALVGEAYKDHPLPIGHKQTISQPFIVAQMTQALGLTGSEKVLEIGTGSGYQTAVLAEICSKVCTIERIRPLMEKARYVLHELGYTNILFKSYDGTLGWEEWAPYDAIIITAGTPSVPDPLLDQLVDGGKMVVPVGDKAGQQLIKITRKKDAFDKKSLGGCRFVDLIGAHGWKE